MKLLFVRNIHVFVKNVTKKLANLIIVKFERAFQSMLQYLYEKCVVHEKVKAEIRQEVEDA